MGCAAVHFCRVGVGEAKNVAGKLYDHALHAETDAEGRHIVFTTPFESDELAFDASLTEAGGDDDAVEA